MKFAIVLIATIATVSAGSVNRGWGTTTTTEPPTTGWPAPTTGWPAPTTAGWGPAPGWSAPNVNIDLAAELAAVGDGWSAVNHAEQVNVHGDAHNPATLISSSGGEALVDQYGSILQVATADNEGASSLNDVSVSQSAAANEGLTYVAAGNDVTAGSSGWASAVGEGGAGGAAVSELQIS